MSKILQIRNSTAEFLTFLTENREDGVQVVYKNETIWATQSAMSKLFDCSSDNIGLHIRNIYAEGELRQEATTEKISVVQQEGKPQGKFAYLYEIRVILWCFWIKYAI